MFDCGSAAKNSNALTIRVDATASSNQGTERFRLTTAGAIGLNGANYGTSGQVLTSQGSSSALLGVQYQQQQDQFMIHFTDKDLMVVLVTVI